MKRFSEALDKFTTQNIFEAKYLYSSSHFVNPSYQTLLLITIQASMEERFSAQTKGTECDDLSITF